MSLGLRESSWNDMKRELLFVFVLMKPQFGLIFCFSFFVFLLADTIKALNEKSKETVAPEPEPEPTTEVLFLCSYEGCGKTFIDAGALRKHSHIHGERQYVCHYEGCGKVFFSMFMMFFPDFPSLCFPCSVCLHRYSKAMELR